MLRKTLAAFAAAASIISIVGIAGTASAATARHSDYFVRTVSGQWVASDQLTSSEIYALDNEADCAPIQWAVLVDQPQYIGGYPVPVIEKVDGGSLVAEQDVTAAQLSAANADQVGLTGIPNFLGPTGYKVVGYTTDASGHLFPVTVCL